MEATSQFFFDGLSPEELALVVAQLERRNFPAGAALLSQGDNPAELYIIQSGTAEVLVSDGYGRSHQVDLARPGDVVGEMSLLTGQPVSATIRAITEVEALVLAEADFNRIGNAVPRIFRNLGVLLANRLRHSHLRHLRPSTESTTLLVDCGAPQPCLLGYALACSMSWHMRRPVLLLVLGEEPPAELAPLARASANETATRRASAQVLAVRPEGEYAIQSLASTIERLRDFYDRVLLMATGDELRQGVPGLEARTIRLFGPPGTPGRTPVAGSPGNGSRWSALGAWVSGSGDTRPGADGVLDVPPLTGPDEAGLREGLLSISSPVGRALGWAARDLAGLKVGLALGAGSEKGYAHIGVLQVLERLGVPIDYLAGTSVGSGVAASRALGHNLAEIDSLVTEVGNAAFRFRLPGASLLSSAGLRDRLRAATGGARFEDVKVPLAVVAADVPTGREVVFRSGPLWPALLASMSIPGVYPALRIGPYVLVDGGIVNPVPGDAVAGLGADRVIAVKLASGAALAPVDATAAEPAGNAPSAIQVLTRSMSIMQSKIIAQTAMASTVLIEPKLQDAGDWRRLRAFSEGRKYIEAGAAAAEEALPRLSAALPWLRAQQAQ